MNLQASELLKISIILYIPFMIEKKMPAVRHNIKLILDQFVCCNLFDTCSFQKDVGQTMLIVIIFFSIIFYSGIGVQNMLKWGALVAIGFIIVATFMFMLDMVPSYLQARFSTLTNPFSQESGTGYHISNSLLAIGNGGLFDVV